MTPDEFITAILGEGWKHEHLPILLEQLKRMNEDAIRYYELRELLAHGVTFVATREQLNEVDDWADSMRYMQ